jgi:hypothetical protein
MSYIVVTTCSGRKRAAGMSVITPDGLAPGSLSEVASAWLNSVSRVSTKRVARNLYCGRTVTEATHAATLLNAELWFISTGLGLIDRFLEIPAYNLTASERGRSWFAEKIPSQTIAWDDWWQEITRRNTSSSSFVELMRDNPEAMVLVAASGPYAQMVRRDLAQLSDGEIKRMRLFGRRLKDVLDPRLHPYIMPYDSRLDGKESPVPGTRGDFAQRALRHFAENILKEAPRGDIRTHRQAVIDALAPLPDIEWPRRTPKSDDQIICLILAHWDEVDGRSQAMLRYLRDKLQVACEQRRFRNLFAQASARRNSAEVSLFPADGVSYGA